MPLQDNSSSQLPKLTAAEIRAMMRTVALNFVRGKTPFEAYDKSMSMLDVMLVDAIRKEQDAKQS